MPCTYTILIRHCATIQNKPTAKAKINKLSNVSAEKGVRFAEVDLNEDRDDNVASGQDGDASGFEDDAEGSEEEEEEEGEPDEFIDVLDMLDGKGEAMSEDEGESSSKKRGTIQAHRSEEDEVYEGDEDEDEDEEKGVSDEGDEDEASEDEEDEVDEPAAIISASEDEDEDGPSKMDSLQSFIMNLDAGQKRKLPEDDGEGSQSALTEVRPPKRRLLQDKTEAGVENEFATHTGTSKQFSLRLRFFLADKFYIYISLGASKLNLDDLLAPLASSSAAASLQSLKKSATILASNSAKTRTLAAPLPTRTQERLGREAAYEQTKGEVDKWNATMKRIKEVLLFCSLSSYKS